MKKAIFLFVFSLVALSLIAQSPEWLWAKQAGGTSQDNSLSIATDNSGNSYVTGYFDGTATFGSTTLLSSGNDDIVIAKLDTYGNWLWAKKAGGTSDDVGWSIATDSSGNCYVTGWFSGTTTFGTTILISSGETDIFITKLDTNGNFLWVKQAGGTSYDVCLGIDTDNSGNSYVTGNFYDTATFDTITLVSNGIGNSDIFIAKLDSAGNYLWAKKAGGTRGDSGTGIATDGYGNIYVTGVFRETATFGTITLTGSGSADIFIAKLDANGNWLWAKKAETYEAYGKGIATDSNGNIYVTGYFYYTVTFGMTTLTSNGGEELFIAKMDTNGNWLWASQAGGTSGDVGRGIATDSSGASYVTGGFSGTATFGITTLTSSGDSDIFIAKLDTNGNFMWAQQAGGTSSDIGWSITTSSIGNSYATGRFEGTATFGSTTLTGSGSWDVFIAKLSSTTGVSDEYVVPQASFSLGQNHPNPFAASTSFSLEVIDAKSVYEVSIYDLRGRHICTLHRGVLPKGERIFTWNGKDAAENQLASGVYFYSVTSGTASQVKKMIYVR